MRGAVLQSPHEEGAGVVSCLSPGVLQSLQTSAQREQRACASSDIPRARV